MVQLGLHHTDIHIFVPGFDTFRDLYATDPLFTAVICQLQNGEATDFILDDGFLFCGVQLCITACRLCQKLIEELHGAGYVGRDSIIKLVQRPFFSLLYTATSLITLYMACCWMCHVSKRTAPNSLKLSVWILFSVCHIHNAVMILFLSLLIDSPKWCILSLTSARLKLSMLLGNFFGIFVIFMAYQHLSSLIGTLIFLAIFGAANGTWWAPNSTLAVLITFKPMDKLSWSIVLWVICFII